MADEDNHTPADCTFCGQRAIGVGLSAKPPHQWICAPCSLLLEDFRKIKRIDAYQLRARQGGMEAAGPLVDEWGSDLAEWSEEQVLQFVGRVWDGCALELRRLVRDAEAPF
jgi:hypothetical protein